MELFFYNVKRDFLTFCCEICENTDRQKSKIRASARRYIAAGLVKPMKKHRISYRWFLGYGLLDDIPHFATVSYAFCKRFPEELTSEIFEHILNKALNNKLLDTSAVFIDGTHIKASANKKKFQKQQVAQTAKVYLPWRIESRNKTEDNAIIFLKAGGNTNSDVLYFDFD